MVEPGKPKRKTKSPSAAPSRAIGRWRDGAYATLASSGSAAAPSGATYARNSAKSAVSRPLEVVSVAAKGAQTERRHVHEADVADAPLREERVGFERPHLLHLAPQPRRRRRLRRRRRRLARARDRLLHVADGVGACERLGDAVDRREHLRRHVVARRRDPHLVPRRAHLVRAAPRDEAVAQQVVVRRRRPPHRVVRHVVVCDDQPVGRDERARAAVAGGTDRDERVREAPALAAGAVDL